MTNTFFHDAWRLLAQEGSGHDVRLVRIGTRVGGNRYNANLLEIAADGALATTSEAAVEVMNLAEAASAGGELSEGVEAPAVDVEGRWIVFVQAGGGGDESFPARVIQRPGGGEYTVRRQVMNTNGQLVDLPGAPDIQATNLSELSWGPGDAVDSDSIVIVHAVAVGVPATGTRYAFDHPVYVKYL